MVDFNRFQETLDLLAEDIEGSAANLRLIKFIPSTQYEKAISIVERELLKVCEKLQALKLDLE